MRFTYPALLGALLILTPPVAANVDIVFDYRYDSSGFFTGENGSRQDVLDDAASAFETRFQDNLTAVSSSGSNQFDISFFRPDTGDLLTIPRFSVAANKIVVFAGAHDLDGSIAEGGPGGYSGRGSAGFLDNARSRGQQGALLALETDFGPWGGAVSFNSNSNWYFDSDVKTDEPFPGQLDFYSVAMHELAHVLGFSSAESFDNLSSDGFFAGSSVNALYGAGPSLAIDGHWAPLLRYMGQEAAMGPNISAGERTRFTDLDYAAMKDIGWEVSPVPEMEIWTMMLAGLGLLGWRSVAHRRRIPALAKR